jgi:hypothetical protein
MAVLINLPGYVFGRPTQEQMNAPITGLPKDTERVKFRFRNNNFVEYFVKTSSGVRRYQGVFKDGAWQAMDEFEIQRNQSL